MSKIFPLENSRSAINAVLFGLVVCFAAVSLTPTVSLAAAESQSGGKPVGSDRDKHGCIGSAGYTWSEVRQDCVRLFEAGAPLYNLQDPSATSVAYVVDGGGTMPLELFLPDEETGILLYYRDGGWLDDDDRYGLTIDKNDVIEVRDAEGTPLFSSRKPKS
ncbi:hypothetical protein [Hoeflea sp. TYP-13]|uniref:hypothetical protein n=1 Tax=Hoeflea sp. TYP-13 TaxID=3230023 RepID=UPI0034C655D7